MRRPILLMLGLTLAVSQPASAGTFAQAPLAPELGLDRLTRGISRQMIGRDVFASPYATVTISNVDVYDRFPYVETRTFQVVSDPQWSRLVAGESGRSLMAFDGRGTAAGALAGPRGLAVDDQNRVYVADAGNNRIVVLQAGTNFDDITFTPLYTIDGLHEPYGVAWSDGGTPFVSGDDVLYVADTGMNRVVAYALGNSAARPVASIGSLGSGVGAFAGPMAVAAGRSQGVNNADLYVADAHNQRIVQLHLAPGGFQWIGEAPAGASVLTSLDTDQWGNLYAAAPQEGVVRKFNAMLEPVAELRDPLAHPRAFHVPFAIVSDHRDGTMRRAGQPQAVSVDQWNDQDGVRLWNLGVAIDGLAVTGGDAPVARFTLTDASTLSLQVADAADGHVLAQRALGPLAAGAHELTLGAADLAGVQGERDVTLRLAAASNYPGGATATALARFRASGSGVAIVPVQNALYGGVPNPVRTSTRIAFALTSAAAQRATLSVIDAGGRRVRGFDRSFAAGRNEVLWDATDDEGHAVRPGLYFCRLDLGGSSFSRRMVVVR